MVRPSEIQCALSQNPLPLIAAAIGEHPHKLSKVPHSRHHSCARDLNAAGAKGHNILFAPVDGAGRELRRPLMRFRLLAQWMADIFKNDLIRNGLGFRDFNVKAGF